MSRDEATLVDIVNAARLISDFVAEFDERRFQTDIKTQSPGCLHCCAERLAKRLQAMGQSNYRDGFAVRVHERFPVFRHSSAMGCRVQRPVV